MSNNDIPFEEWVASKTFKELPRPCGLEAAEKAWALANKGIPSRLLSIGGPGGQRHSVLVFRLPNDKSLYCYDSNGTVKLNSSDDALTVARSFNPGVKDAHWKNAWPRERRISPRDRRLLVSGQSYN